MLAAIRSAAVIGIDAYDVTVEVDVAQGLPQWTIVGLPSGAVKESRERVCAALANAGFKVPPRRVTVNLSPADTRKDGSHFDLPIAIALLVALGAVPAEATTRVVAVGELGLDGVVRPVRGALPVARRVALDAGRGQDRARTLVLPAANVAEASLVSGIRLAAPRTVAELVAWLRAGRMPAPELVARPAPPPDDGDFAEVVGQRAAKRALEIAAAGGHACLMIGPPGAGKTMLARRLPSILPSLTEEEALEVTAIHSVAGLTNGDAAMVAARPFRAPHHSVSAAGLVGGGGSPRPGEVSLAHNGVLFLDELLEFPRYVLESLRQPMEDGRVVISRAATTVTFPARFALVAAMNPCPCGNAGEATRVCSCGAAEVERYRARLSGPLADRIDMHVPVGAVPVGALTDAAADGERSCAVRARVEAARAVQRARYACTPHVRSNASAPGQWLLAHGNITPAARVTLADAVPTLGLSARAYHRALRVARTIADLDGSRTVERHHVAEAVRYRPAEQVPAMRAAAG